MQLQTSFYLPSTSALGSAVGRVPADAWSEGRLEGAGATDWFRVTVFDEGHKVIGITRDGQWAWATNDEARDEFHPMSGDGVLGTLPLLEFGPGEMADKARSASAILGLKARALVATLPLEALIGVALDLGTEYWVERALEWMEAFDGCAVPRERIAASAADASLPQLARDRLWRLAQAQPSDAARRRAPWTEAARKALAGSLNDLTCPGCGESALDGAWRANTDGFEELHLECRRCGAHNFALKADREATTPPLRS